MIYMKFSVTKLEFEGNRLKKDLKEYFLEVFYDAVRAFVREAYKKVPVRTGMARGSFLPLVKKLDMAMPPFPITHRNERYYHAPARKQIKTPSLGASLTKIKLPDKRNSTTYNLEITIQTKYFGPMDTKVWNAFAEGIDAMKRRLDVAVHLQTGRKRPRLKDYVHIIYKGV